MKKSQLVSVIKTVLAENKMKKSQLVSAIKTVLAENKKQKLDENSIRQIIREVLAEASQYMKIGGRFYEVEVDEEGNTFIQLFNGPKITVQPKGEEPRSIEDIQQDIKNNTKASSGDMGYDAEIADIMKYGTGGKFGDKNTKGYGTFGKGKLGQVPRHLRKDSRD
jgi:hypothetical protein